MPAYSSYRVNFSKLQLHNSLILDYCRQKSELRDLYSAFPSVENIAKQCSAKAKTYNSKQRKLLYECLQSLHQKLNLSPSQQQNLEKLNNANTFTITTAHQANIFSGPLYTIYKIAHCLRIAQELNHSLKDYHFVPIFFIGSEDHDTEELNHIFLHKRKFSWQSSQEGAFGRRTVDQNLQQLIRHIQHELSAYPQANELANLLACYQDNQSISQAYLHFLQILFQDYGLLFLQPDDAKLKASFISIFEEDIFHNSTQRTILPTTAELENLGYKVQVMPRQINTFYLAETLRNRIIHEQGNFYIHGTHRKFNSQELRQHLRDFPENFSPNVCLRGLFQEYILPNVTYVGGGGEIAYWLELKALFSYHKIPFPILWIRHSIVFLDNPQLITLLQKSQLSYEEILQNPQNYANNFVRTQHPEYREILEKYNNQISEIYANLRQELDNNSLNPHIQALEHKHIKQLIKLQSKLYRYQKNLNNTQINRQNRLHNAIFPNGILQERYENILSYYAKYGKNFIKIILDNIQQYTEPMLHFILHKN